MGCIDGFNRTDEELKKNSIYHITSNDQFEEALKKGVDYEFVVFCGDSKVEFVKKIKDLFDNFGDSQLAKDIEKTIENLPGRIIIINQKPTNWDKKSEPQTDKEKFQEWVKKRIAWVNGEKVDWNSLQLKKLKEQKTKEIQINDEIERTKLKLWEVWLDHIVRDLLGVQIDYSISVEGLETLTKLNILQRLKTNQNMLVESIRTKLNMSEEHLNILNFTVRAILEKGCIKYNPPDCNNDEIKEGLNDGPVDSMLQRLKNLSELYSECITCVEETELFREIDNVVNKMSDYISDWLSVFGIAVNSNMLQQIVSSFIPAFGITSHVTFGKGTVLIPIYFRRHGDVTPIRYCKTTGKNVKKIYYFASVGDDAKYYHENLSASTIHFELINSALHNKESRVRMLYSLIENGLFRILVADERIARYVANNKKAKDNFSVSGIDVVKSIKVSKGSNAGEEKADELQFADGDLETFGTLKDCITEGVYHMLIIHQGILDRLSGSGENLEEIIRHWKFNYFPYIFVTSGRGVPAQVPTNSKFIPFSVVESALIRTYHEKFILTQIIMKSLPGKEKA